MPIKKLCPRCRKVVDSREKHCEACDSFYKSRHTTYYKRFRNKKNHTFYTSGSWLGTRQRVMSDYDGLDIYQLLVNGRTVGADMVHHIVELNEDWNMRLSLDNLIPLSNDTHMLVHSMYRTDKAQAQELLRRCKYEYQQKYKKG